MHIFTIHIWLYACDTYVHAHTQIYTDNATRWVIGSLGMGYVSTVCFHSAFPQCVSTVSSSVCFLGVFPHCVSLCSLGVFPPCVSTVCFLGVYSQCVSRACFHTMFPSRVSTACFHSVFPQRLPTVYFQSVFSPCVSSFHNMLPQKRNNTETTARQH